MSQSLIDHVIEVDGQLGRAATHIRAGQPCNLFPGDNGAAAGAQQSRLGNRFAVAGHDERFPAGTDSITLALS